MLTIRPMLPATRAAQIRELLEFARVLLALDAEDVARLHG
jgi:hypothetical protein